MASKNLVLHQLAILLSVAQKSRCARHSAVRNQGQPASQSLRCFMLCMASKKTEIFSLPGGVGIAQKIVVIIPPRIVSFCERLEAMAAAVFKSGLRKGALFIN